MAPWAAQASARLAAVVDFAHPALARGHRHDVLDVRQGLERPLYGMCGDLRPQLQLQAVLTESGCKVGLQARPQVPAGIVGTGEAQYEIDAHGRRRQV